MACFLGIFVFLFGWLECSLGGDGGEPPLNCKTLIWTGLSPSYYVLGTELPLHGRGHAQDSYLSSSCSLFFLKLSIRQTVVRQTGTGLGQAQWANLTPGRQRGKTSHCPTISTFLHCAWGTHYLLRRDTALHAPCLLLIHVIKWQPMKKKKKTKQKAGKLESFYNPALSSRQKEKHHPCQKEKG